MDDFSVMKLLCSPSLKITDDQLIFRDIILAKLSSAKKLSYHIITYKISVNNNSSEMQLLDHCYVKYFQIL